MPPNTESGQEAIYSCWLVKEKLTKSAAELSVGQKVTVLEHSGCAGTTGTVVKIEDRNAEIRCDDCKKKVIVDHRH